MSPVLICRAEDGRVEHRPTINVTRAVPARNLRRFRHAHRGGEQELVGTDAALFREAAHRSWDHDEEPDRRSWRSGLTTASFRLSHVVSYPCIDECRDQAVELCEHVEEEPAGREGPSARRKRRRTNIERMSRRAIARALRNVAHFACFAADA
jgi:hypothetical protein